MTGKANSIEKTPPASAVHPGVMFVYLKISRGFKEKIRPILHIFKIHWWIYYDGIYDEKLKQCHICRKIEKQT